MVDPWIPVVTAVVGAILGHSLKTSADHRALRLNTYATVAAGFGALKGAADDPRAVQEFRVCLFRLLVIAPWKVAQDALAIDAMLENARPSGSEEGTDAEERAVSIAELMYDSDFLKAFANLAINMRFDLVRFGWARVRARRMFTDLVSFWRRTPPFSTISEWVRSAERPPEKGSRS